MAFPVRPSDFLNVVVLAEDSLGAAIVKTFVRLPVLIYKLLKYMINADGTFTPEFEADICALECAKEEEEP